MIPVDHERTRMLIISSRSFLRFAVFDRVFALTNNRVALEDKAVVESSFPSEVPDAKDELSVRTDKLPLLFRKYYRNTLRETLPVLVAETPRERSTQVQ